MEKAPDAAILDREDAIDDAKKLYSEHIDFLESIVNYGTNLIIRTCPPAISASVDQSIVCAVLLKQVVTMFDAATVLLRQGTAYPASIQVRVACESAFFIEYILQRSSPYRARAYLVGEFRARRNFAKKTIRGTREHEAFKERMKKAIQDDAFFDKIQDEATADIERITQRLAQPNFIEIDKRFDKLSKSFDIEWYRGIGVKNIREMAQILDREVEYHLYYDQLSKVVHSRSYGDHITFKFGGTVLKKVRHLENAHEITQGVSHIAVIAYSAVVKKYLPEEWDNLRDVYLKKWREFFHSKKRIKYEYERPGA